MEVVKEPNFDGLYDVSLIQDNKIMRMSFARVLDYSLSMSDGHMMDLEESYEMYFEIKPEHGELYKAFEELYTDIIECNPHGERKKKRKRDYWAEDAWERLVDKNGVITYISDDSIPEIEDKVRIEKIDDNYRLTFVRNDLPGELIAKDPDRICIRIRTSGGKYEMFFEPFQRFFHALQALEVGEIVKPRTFKRD